MKSAHFTLPSEQFCFAPICRWKKSITKHRKNSIKLWYRCEKERQDFINFAFLWNYCFKLLVTCGKLKKKIIDIELLFLLLFLFTPCCVVFLQMYHLEISTMSCQVLTLFVLLRYYDLVMIDYGYFWKFLPKIKSNDCFILTIILIQFLKFEIYD